VVPAETSRGNELSGRKPALLMSAGFFVSASRGLERIPSAAALPAPVCP